MQVANKGAENFSAGVSAMSLHTMSLQPTQQLMEEDIPDETVKVTKEELEELRKSNYFLINNGNVVNGGPIMKNIEPKVEEVV